MNNPIGVLQGRLTPSRGRGIQFFPGEPGEWEREFELASEIGISHIQWVCDTTQNPVFDKEFRKKVKAVISKTGIPVKNMDVQLLVKLDIAQCPDELVTRLCEAVADIEAGTIEIPLLEGSSLLDRTMRPQRLTAFEQFLKAGQKYGVGVAIETDPPPDDLSDILKSYPSLTVVYDSGNSAGMGYDVEAELNTYGERISNVHIKDRLRGGSTVPLGTGFANFARLFKLLRTMEYTGPITLQAARGEDGQEVKTVQGQVMFVKKHLN